MPPRARRHHRVAAALAPEAVLSPNRGLLRAATTVVSVGFIGRIVNMLRERGRSEPSDDEMRPLAWEVGMCASGGPDQCPVSQPVSHSPPLSLIFGQPGYLGWIMDNICVVVCLYGESVSLLVPSIVHSAFCLYACLCLELLFFPSLFQSRPSLSALVFSAPRVACHACTLDFISLRHTVALPSIASPCCCVNFLSIDSSRFL